MRATHWSARISVLTLAHVVGTLHMVSVMAMAPVIAPDLGLSATEVGLLVTGYYGAQTIGAIPAGGLADRLGVGWALLTAHGLLAAGALVFARSAGFADAFLATVVMGCGYSIVNPATAKGVLEWFSAARRATAMGVKQTGVPIGGVLAAGNGALAALLSWQSILIGVAGVTLASGLACVSLVERRRAVAGFDARAVIASLLRVGRNANIRVVFVASVPWNMGQATFFTYLTLFMREAAMASQPVAGLCLGVAQVASALGRVGWGLVSDTLFRGARKRLTVGLCGSGAAFMVAMTAVGPGWGVGLGLGLALALGLTIASYASLAQTLAVEAVDREESASAMGYSLVGTSLGGMLGPPLFGAVVDLTGSFANGWVVTALLVAAGTALLAVRFEERRR